MAVLTAAVDGSPIIGFTSGSSAASWALRTSLSAGQPNFLFNYGLSSWEPVLGGWTGTGSPGIGEFDPSTATWYLRTTISAGSPDITPFAYRWSWFTRCRWRL